MHKLAGLLLLGLLAALGTVYTVPIFFGMAIGFHSLFLLLALRRYGTGWGLLLAAGIAVLRYVVTGDAASSANVLLEAGFVAAAGALGLRSLLAADALFWLAVGSASTALQYYGRFHGFHTELFLMLFKDAVNGLTCALAAELILDYGLLRSRKPVSFRHIVFHLAMTAVVVPFLGFMATVGYFQYQDMSDHAGKLASNVSASVTSELNGWSADDLGLLQLNALIQVSRLDSLVQRYGRESAVDVVVMNGQGRVYASSNRDIPLSRWDWRSGGEVRRTPGRLDLWLPERTSVYELSRWNAGYFVSRTELSAAPLLVLIRVPASHYLLALERLYAVNSGTLLLFILLTSLAGYGVSRWLSGGLLRLARLTSGLDTTLRSGSGAPIEWPETRIVELSTLVANFQGLWSRLTALFEAQEKANGKLERQAALLRQSEERLTHLAYYDPLTGLRNRLYAMNRLEQLLAERYGETGSLALLTLDLDRFKTLNDAYGHAVGDAILKEAARRLSEALPEGTVCRLSSDEFVALLPEAGEEQAGACARRMLAVMELPFGWEGATYRLTASIGVSVYPEDAQDPNGLFRLADLAMLEAKEAGGNGWRLAGSLMQNGLQDRLQLEKELKRALARKELQLLYQPRVHVSSGRISGAEAVLRWLHPERGPLPSERLLAAAEHAGLLPELSGWLLREAAAQAGRWQRAGWDVPVAVDALPRQLYGTRLPEALAAALEQEGLDPQLLELEVSAEAVYEHPEAAQLSLERLAGLGVNVTLDHFGRGAVSVDRLAGLPVQVVKLDRELILLDRLSPRHTFVLQALVDLARSLRLQVAAEGVGSEEALAMVLQHRVDSIQGDALCPPVTAAELERLLEKQPFADRLRREAWKGERADATATGPIRGAIRA